MADIRVPLSRDQVQVGAQGVQAGGQTQVLLDGILELYRHAGLQGDRQNKRCIIFVHGLTGNIRSTWKKKHRQEEPEVPSFLELITADKDLYDYDAFSFGYRSRYVRGAPIKNAAVQLRFAIDQVAALGYGGLVLLAHSMGGLVCMRYILDQLGEGTVPPIAGLLLYGTPTTGSDMLKAAKLVGYGIGIKIPVVRPLLNLFLRGQRQIAELATGSEFLAVLHEQWALRVVNGGHERAGRNGRMWLPVSVITGEDDFLVTDASGKGVYGAIDWFPISCGHVELVKPGGSNDPRYVRAKRFLEICRQEKGQDILDPIWQASQNIWAARVGRVIENLDFQTFIGMPDTDQKTLRALGYNICIAECAYDVTLEGTELLFGVAIDDSGTVWRQSPQPVYVHEVGLSLLPEAERRQLRRAIDSILINATDDEQAWSGLVPKVEIRISEAGADGRVADHLLNPGDIISDAQTRRYSRWLLRRYSLPINLQGLVGSKIKLKLCYHSFVPVSLGHFFFFSPWVIKAARVRVLVHGRFEYFLASSRLMPPAKPNVIEAPPLPDRRDVTFEYPGVIIPGPAFEVRWQHTSN